MDVPTYQYSSLSQKLKWPFRILKLHGGAPGSPLAGSIIDATLEQHHASTFDALSYVWGSPEGQTTPLLIENTDQGAQSIEILPSLHAALCRLRKPNSHRLLWVDALCINQADDVERSQQIPMMGKIYHYARSVIIWLGEEAEGSALALDFIPRITDLAQFDHIIKDQSLTHQWYALSRLMNRSWFTRRWVVQELAFARDAKLYCGDGEVDWASFADAATLFGERQQDIVKLFWLSAEYAHDAEILGEIKALGALRLIDALNRLFRRSEDNQILEGLVSLETLVTSLNVFETKDPRDCIYAVMRLAEDAQDILSGVSIDLRIATRPELDFPTLDIDYTLPFDEIARGFVAFCIKSSGSLDIICRPWAPIPNYYSTPHVPSQSTQRLSSWACTLDDSVFEIRQDGHHSRKKGDSFVGMPGKPIYQASKGFPFIPFDSSFEHSNTNPDSYLEIAQFPIDGKWSFKAPRMEVKGVKIGTVQYMGERAIEGIIPMGWFHLAKWPSRRGPVPDAFYRTLIADRNPSGGNPPSWYKRALEHALLNSGNGDVRLQRMLTQCKSSVTSELLRRVQATIWSRRLIVTDQGAMGLTPAGTLVSDVVMVLYGASVPVVLRKLESSYWLIGECYIHGAMDGMKSNSRPEPTGSPYENGSGSVLGGGGPPMNQPQIVSLR
jgi:hypothetical protein